MKTHKGLRLGLRWRIIQRQRQRRRKEHKTQVWGVVPTYIPLLRVSVHHSTLSVLCQYGECAELKEYKELLARQGFELYIEKLTTVPANCSKCLIRQTLTELRELKSLPMQPAE